MSNKQYGVIRFYILLAFGFALLFLGAYMFGKFYMQGQEAAKDVSLKEVPTEEVEEATSSEDTHLEEVMETTESTISPEEMEIGEDPDTQAIKEAFSEKYDRPVTQIEVSVDESTGELARGGVHFIGETGGSWFLAAKVDDEWVIVDDGNGTISCQKIEGYDFPTSMVPECYDEVEMTSVTR